MENMDIRRKFINNQYNENDFKKILHQRDKKNFFLKQLAEIVIYTYEIAELILWSIVDLIPKNQKIPTEIVNQINKNIDLLKKTANDTDKNINKLTKDFGYTTDYSFSISYLFSHRRIF
jgi:hypothetical protein